MPGEQQLLSVLHTPSPPHLTPTPTRALLAARALSGSFKQEMGRSQGLPARAPPAAQRLHRKRACILQGLHRKLQPNLEGAHCPSCLHLASAAQLPTLGKAGSNEYLWMFFFQRCQHGQRPRKGRQPAYSTALCKLLPRGTSPVQLLVPAQGRLRQCWQHSYTFHTLCVDML